MFKRPSGKNDYFSAEFLAHHSDLFSLKHGDASVQVRETWGVVEELDFPVMSKLLLPGIGKYLASSKTNIVISYLGSIEAS